MTLKPILLAAAITSTVLLPTACFSPNMISRDTGTVSVTLTGDSGVTKEIFTGISGITVSLSEDGGYSAEMTLLPDIRAGAAVIGSVEPGEYTLALSVTSEGRTNTLTITAETVNVSPGSQTAVRIVLGIAGGAFILTSYDIGISDGLAFWAGGFVQLQDNDKGYVKHQARTSAVGSLDPVTYLSLGYPDGYQYFAGQKTAAGVNHIITPYGFIAAREWPDPAADPPTYEPLINGTYTLTLDYGAGLTLHGSDDVALDFADGVSWPETVSPDLSSGIDASSLVAVTVTVPRDTQIGSALIYVTELRDNEQDRVIYGEVTIPPVYSITVPVGELSNGMRYTIVALVFDAQIDPAFAQSLLESQAKFDMESVVNMILALDGIRDDIDIDYIGGITTWFETL